MQNPIQELLQCAICLGQVSKPRVLPCFHSFCESCLTTHIRTTINPGRHVVAKFQCPSCRVTTDLPPNGPDGFPLDFRLNKFTDALKEIVNLKKEGICGVCYTDEHFKEARQFCADCQKYFCNDCSTKHHLTPVLSTHFMLDLPTGQVGGPVCHTHAKEAAKYVCTTCLYPVCVICVMGKHKFHSISHLNVSSSLQRTELHRGITNIREQIWAIHETLFHLTCLEGRLKGLYEESRLQIKKQSRKLINRILGDEGLLLKDLDVIYDAKVGEVFKLKEKCRDRLLSYESLQSHVGTVLRSENIHQLLVKFPSINEELMKTKHSSSPLLSEELLTFVRFKRGKFFQLGKLLEVDLKQESRKVSQRLETLTLDTTESNTSGEESEAGNYAQYFEQFETVLNHQAFSNEVDTVVQNVIPATEHSQNTQPALFYPYQEPPELQSVFGNYGRSMGSICLPYNICFTPDDKLVVAENGNRRLQVFDLNGESLNIIGSGDIIPRCVTLTTSGDIAVTDELSKTIKVYDLEGDLKMTLNPVAATFPFGLATSQAGHFIFTDMIFENVTITTASGILKRQFGSHGYTEDRFDNPGYIAVNNEDKVFVSDSSNHAIKVFDMNGLFCYKFGGYGSSLGKVRYPKALCFDTSGNVFVADSGNDRVLLFSNKGEFLGKVVDRDMGLQRPTGLAYSASGLLAVSMPDLNEIRVYRMIPAGTSIAYPAIRL